MIDVRLRTADSGNSVSIFQQKLGNGKANPLACSGYDYRAFSHF
jgi:hypothetical protein